MTTATAPLAVEREAPARRFDLVRACEFLLVAIVLFAASAAVYHAVREAARPAQIDYEEGNILNAALRITQGATPYGNPYAWPKIFNTYGPVTYYLAAIPVKLFGPRLTAPRLMVIFFSVLCAVFLALIVRQQTRSLVAALIFGPLFLTMPNVRDWMPLLRVDLVGLAFTLAGLYVFLRSPKRWWVAAVLLAAGVYTKQSLIAAPAACALWYLVRKEWREAARFVGLLAAIGLIVLAAFDLATAGAFSFNLLRTYNHAWWFLRYQLLMSEQLHYHVLLVVLGGAALLAAAWQRRMSPLIFWMVLSIATSFTAGKVGSNSNHLLEFNAVLCAGGALGWMAVQQARGARPYLGIGLAAACAVLAVPLLLNVPAPPPDPGSGCLAEEGLVRNHPGNRILSENISLLVTSGKPVFLSNPFVYTQFVRRDHWDDSDFRQMIADRRFDLIILGNAQVPPAAGERWTTSMARVIGENYRPLAKFNCQDAAMIWAPLPAASTPGN